MRVIFLDVDGVLNADCDFGGRSKPNPFVIQNGTKFDGICITHVKVLKEIVDKTGAKIVLVSSWKKDFEEYRRRIYNPAGKYLNNKIRQVGLDIYDTTLRYDKTGGMCRGQEIRDYLKDHPEVENYLIIDDVIWGDYDDELKAHLYRTYSNYGLHDAEYPVYMLTGIKTEEIIRREREEKSWKKFCLDLTNVAMPELIPAETVIVQPLKK